MLANTTTIQTRTQGCQLLLLLCYGQLFLKFQQYVLLSSFIDKEADSNKSSKLPKVTQHYGIPPASVPASEQSKTDVLSLFLILYSHSLVFLRSFICFCFLFPLSLFREENLMVSLLSFSPSEFFLIPHCLPASLPRFFPPKAFLSGVTDSDDSPQPSQERGKFSSELGFQKGLLFHPWNFIVMLSFISLGYTRCSSAFAFTGLP